MKWYSIALSIFCLLLVACAPEERMDAYILKEYPRAKTLAKVSILPRKKNQSTHSSEVVYILRNEGQIVAVGTDRSILEANIHHVTAGSVLSSYSIFRIFALTCISQPLKELTKKKEHQSQTAHNR